MRHHQWVVNKPEVTPCPLPLSLLRLGVREGGEVPQTLFPADRSTFHWSSSVLSSPVSESSSAVYAKKKKLKQKWKCIFFSHIKKSKDNQHRPSLSAVPLSEQGPLPPVAPPCLLLKCHSWPNTAVHTPTLHPCSSSHQEKRR